MKNCYLIIETDVVPKGYVPKVSYTLCVRITNRDHTRIFGKEVGRKAFRNFIGKLLDEKGVRKR